MLSLVSSHILLRSLRKYKKKPWPAFDKTRMVCKAFAFRSRENNLLATLSEGYRWLLRALGGACASTPWIANVSYETVRERLTPLQPVWKLCSRCFRVSRDLSSSPLLRERKACACPWPRSPSSFLLAETPT